MNVEDLLTSKEIAFIPKGGDFLVRCLNPEHADRNPSMRIDQITGIFNCFSCEYKGNLFTLYGEQQNLLQIRRDMLKKKIQEVRAENLGLSFPKESMPYIGNWRDIRPETYRKFEAFQQQSLKEFQNRIVFPIRDRTTKIVAFVGRHTAMGTPKYLNSPSGAKMPLFPVVRPILGSVLLVEGMFDMLNLHDKGLDNAVCCFGVKNVTEDRLAILGMQGVSNIDLFFDNDEAGQAASVRVQGLCEKVGLTSRIIKFGSKDVDPGALKESQVKNLRIKLYA
jgi:DNA primase